MSIVFCDRCESRSSLRANDVHVFVHSITTETEPPSCLIPAEQQRADRFRLPRIRQQFIQTRSWLRTMLAEYLDCSPLAVPIEYAENGKPHLPAKCGLHFNVSHTEGLAVLAISQHRVGVDIERERPFRDALGLVERFFSPQECTLFRQLPESDITEAFFRAWTRKEAILKALGRGVQLLDCCEVTFQRQDPPRLLRLDDDVGAGARWQLYSWEPANGYVGALAVEHVAALAE